MCPADDNGIHTKLTVTTILSCIVMRMNDLILWCKYIAYTQPLHCHFLLILPAEPLQQETVQPSVTSSGCGEKTTAISWNTASLSTAPHNKMYIRNAWKSRQTILNQGKVVVVAENIEVASSSSQRQAHHIHLHLHNLESLHLHTRTVRYLHTLLQSQPVEATNLLGSTKTHDPLFYMLPRNLDRFNVDPELALFWGKTRGIPRTQCRVWSHYLRWGIYSL